MTVADKFILTFKRIYLKIMFFIVGRALVAASQVDEEFAAEIKGFPAGLTIQMMVMPNGPCFTFEVQHDHRLKLSKNPVGEADLVVRFKHLVHAFLVFSFQEGTARAFAHDRMFVDGDVSQAIRLTRMMNRLEVLILPKIIAKGALKRYPSIGLGEKLAGGAKIYGRLTLNLLKGA